MNKTYVLEINDLNDDEHEHVLNGIKIVLKGFLEGMDKKETAGFKIQLVKTGQIIGTIDRSD